jgi:hypothetical protein
MMEQREKNDYRFTCLVEAIVLSPQFRSQRGKDCIPKAEQTLRLCQPQHFLAFRWGSLSSE